MKISDKYRNLFISAAIAFIYFCALYHFYNIRYFVPDYFNYSKFAAQNLPAKDGFSSLFIDIFKFGPNYPVLLHFISLLCLSVALAILIFLCLQLTNDKKFRILSILAISGIMSCGIWYYFYGKLVYDFPFTALVYCIGLLFLFSFLRNDDPKNERIFWYLFVVTAGFCLSWKPYNIFALSGYAFLLFLKQKNRKKLYSRMISFKKTIFIICFFLFGYFVGYYYILVKPLEVLLGIRAYPAKSNPISFFFTGRLIHDHINNVGFCLGVMAISSMVIILFLLPLICKKYFAFTISFLVLFAFCIYLKFFSPGYLWHGFPLGLFILTALISIIYEGHVLIGIRKKLFISLLILAVGLQCVNNFLIYIPKEMSWFHATYKATDYFETHASEILNKLIEISKQYKGKYDVFINLYRYSFNEGSLERISPLRVGAPERWDELFGQEKFSPKEADFILYTIPTSFFDMKEVVPTTQFQGLKELERYENADYTIIVYEKEG